MDLDTRRIAPLVEMALQEDVGQGDITSEAIVPPDAIARGEFVLRRAGVIAGLPVAACLYGQVSEDVRFQPLVEDGDALPPGTAAARIAGPARAVLAGERTALNFLQRLSGVATLTRRCVEAVAGTACVIQDTRKTIPGWRLLDKYAVTVGGGTNHRMGLHDRVLIKDNHLQLARGDIATCVRRARAHVAPTIEVEAECETRAQVQAALQAGADIIMLDNMSLDEMTHCASLVKAARDSAGTPRPVTEASGGLALDDLACVAATGVDRVSLGALTHSAPALDIGLDFE